MAGLRWITRGAWIRIGIFAFVVVAALIVYEAVGNFWTKPRSQGLSEAFERSVKTGMPLTEIEAKAREFGADRFRVLEALDSRGRLKQSVRVLWYWYPLGLWPAGRACDIALAGGKAESVACQSAGL